MPEPSLRTPSTPATSSDAAELIRLNYDATGIQSVTLVFTTLVGWVFDSANPLTPGTIPIGIANMGPAPPNTAPIVSPQWAVCYLSGGVFTANEVFCGQFSDFLPWLATNNGASRILSAPQIPTAFLKNTWAEFARAYPQYVAP